MYRHPAPSFERLVLTLAIVVSGAFGFVPESSFGQRVQGAYAGNDPTLPVIDVYYHVGFFQAGMTDDMTAEDVVAGDFIDVPANVSITASIAEGSSTSVADAFYSDSFSFSADTNYVQVVNGLRVPGNFTANPDGRSTAIEVHPIDNVKRFAAHEDSVDLIVYHGSTDTPAVDVTVRGGAMIGNALSYGDRSGAYVAFKSGEVFTLDVTLAGGGTIIESYVGVFPSAISGQAAILMIRGFLDPSSNAGGRALALTVVPASGAAFELALESSTGIDGRAARELPSDLMITSVYPNPISRSGNAPIVVRMVINSGADAEPGFVSRPVNISLVDVLGRERELGEWTVSAGIGTIDVPLGSTVATGNYLLVLRSGNLRSSSRIVVR